MRSTQFVCPACRSLAGSFAIGDDLRCTNAVCDETYPRLDNGIPVMFPSAQRASVLEFDTFGALEPFDTLAERLDALPRDDFGWEVVHRAVSYLWTHAGVLSNSPALPSILLDALLPKAPMTRVLDMACGVGSFARELSRRLDSETELVALDSNIAALRWALVAESGQPIRAPWRTSAWDFEMRDVPEAPCEPGRVVWICGNAVDPPFSGGSFDLVCLFNALDSYYNPALGLAQAAALLRPGGHVLLAQPDAWMPHITPPANWLASDAAAWDAAFAEVGLETVEQIDGIDWTVQATPRVRHMYTLHGRLARLVG